LKASKRRRVFSAKRVYTAICCAQKESGLTPVAFAKYVGVERTTFFKWMHRNPTRRLSPGDRSLARLHLRFPWDEFRPRTPSGEALLEQLQREERAWEDHPNLCVLEEKLRADYFALEMRLKQQYTDKRRADDARMEVAVADAVNMLARIRVDFFGCSRLLMRYHDQLDEAQWEDVFYELRKLHNLVVHLAKILGDYHTTHFNNQIFLAEEEK